MIDRSFQSKSINREVDHNNQRNFHNVSSIIKLNFSRVIWEIIGKNEVGVEKISSKCVEDVKYTLSRSSQKSSEYSVFSILFYHPKSWWTCSFYSSVIELSGNFPLSFRNWTCADLVDYDEWFDVNLSSEDGNYSLRSHYCLMSLEPNFKRLSTQALTSDKMMRDVILLDFDHRWQLG